MAAKRITSVDDVRALGTILGVWAHPDDESFTCAGLMTAAVQNGQMVACITATKGELGVQDETRWPAERLGEIRSAEMQAAMKAIGINYHHWLGYMDGSCHLVPDETAVAEIKKYIAMYQPDTILTFAPDGITGHTDHQAASRWATLAAAGTGVTVYYAVENKENYDKHMKALDKKFNIYFNIDKPHVVPCADCDICFILSPDCLRTKYEALKVMPSQTEGMLQSQPREMWDDILAMETFVRIPVAQTSTRKR
jgi:LmbE family N-acetylglucosaminyl deacetylase